MQEIYNVFVQATWRTKTKLLSNVHRTEFAIQVEDNVQALSNINILLTILGIYRRAFALLICLQATSSSRRMVEIAPATNKKLERLATSIQFSEIILTVKTLLAIKAQLLQQ